MAFDPGNRRQLSRLRDSMVQSGRKLEPFRKKRLELIRQYTGQHYGSNGPDQAVPVNLIELALNIFLRRLIASNPRVLVRTRADILKAQATNFGLAMNRLFEEIKLVKTLRTLVADALFSIGIAKTGIASTGTVEVDGFTHDRGQPYSDAVSLDDWVHDMRAERWDQISFAGDRYYRAFSSLKDEPRFDQKVVARLKPDTSKYEQQDGFWGQDRASNLSQGSNDFSGEFEDTIALWDMWLPESNVLLTFPANDQDSVLSAEPWDGPEDGPYTLLGFSTVPGNIMPLSPLVAGLDMHRIVNQVYRKLTNQAQRQKDVTTYRGSAHADARRIVHAADGEMLRVDDPKSVTKTSFGGVDTNNFVFGQHVTNLFKEFMGNLDSLGGLGPQSETLGQDRLVAKAASARIEDMGDSVQAAVTDIVDKLGWYLWYDPLIDMPLTKRIGERSIDTRFSAADREGDFLDYNIELDPYSMQKKSPSERLAAIMSFHDRVLAPGSQVMAAQGVETDYRALVDTFAKLSDIEEIKDIVKSVEPSEIQTGGERPIQSPVTSRTNTRINSSQPQDPDGALLSNLTSDGGEQQLSQRAAVA